MRGPMRELARRTWPAAHAGWAPSSRSSKDETSMTLLIGAMTMGFILALLALGVYLSFRIFNIPDMTVEGTVTLGASVAAIMMVHRYNPVVATLVAALAGTAAGAVTGILATKCRINALL